MAKAERPSLLWRIHDAACPFWLTRNVPVLRVLSRVMLCCRLHMGKQRSSGV